MLKQAPDPLLASNMDIFAEREQLAYGELAVREIETSIVTVTRDIVASACMQGGREGGGTGGRYYNISARAPSSDISAM